MSLNLMAALANQRYPISMSASVVGGADPDPKRVG